MSKIVHIAGNDVDIEDIEESMSDGSIITDVIVIARSVGYREPDGKAVDEIVVALTNSTTGTIVSGMLNDAVVLNNESTLQIRRTCCCTEEDDDEA